MWIESCMKSNGNDVESIKYGRYANVTLSCGIVKSVWWFFQGKSITIKLQKDKGGWLYDIC